MIAYTTLGEIANHCQTASAVDFWPDSFPLPEDIETYPAMLFGETEYTEYALGHDEGKATFEALGDPIPFSALK